MQRMLILRKSINLKATLCFPNCSTSMRYLFFACFIFLSGFSNGQQLQRYRMYSDHFDIEKYTKQYNRAFDSNGVITQKGQYHALTISLYGIMCFDEFQRTGDSLFLNRVLDQYKYFSDTSNLTVKFDGKGIGLPYHFKFHELKPPWYSGLTQGIAVSFLLRYWELTKDQEALELAKKINYVMIQPFEEGGTLTKTQEGKLWIEEYPGSKRSKHVLNGFINGLVGLREYCMYFPEDTMASRIHDEVYESFKFSLPLYDLNNNWTCYDRNNKKISVAYLRIQMTQLDHLYDLYGDDFLYKQMMIWGMMLNAKRDSELKFYKKPEYCYSKTVSRDNESLDYLIDYTFLYDSILVANEEVQLSDLKNSYVLNESLQFKTSFNVDLPVPQTHFEVIGSKLPKRIKVYGIDQEGEESEVLSRISGSKISISSKQLYTQFTLKSRSLFARKFIIDSVRYYNYRSLDIPLFGYHLLHYTVTMEAGKSYWINVKSIDATNLTAFYKMDKDEGMLFKSKWFWDNAITNFDEPFIAPIDGCYEFFLSYQITNPKSGVGEFIIEEVK